ncbi:MAG: hypothetical protein VCC02_06310 [Myxococcota bacterium]|jgi:lipoate-protein ligase A
MRWRRIDHGAASGPYNMGVDEGLLRAASRGIASLRFYEWSGTWLSLGYSQPSGDSLGAACEAAGVGWVRRATGGRALLHGRDLTYCVAVPEAMLPGTLAGAYGAIGAGLEAGLRALGVPVTRAGLDAEGPPKGAFDCFAHPAASEILLAGRKLVGSAQRRTAFGVMQHGSLALTPHAPELRAALGVEASKAISLEEWGTAPSARRIRDALCEALAAVLAGEMVVAVEELGASEEAAAKERGRVPLRR